MLLGFRAFEPLAGLYLTQGLVMPVAGVYSGTLVAPAYRLQTGAVLFFLWLLLTGVGVFGEVPLSIAANPGWHAAWAVAAAALLPSVPGAAAALALVYMRERERSLRPA